MFAQTGKIGTLMTLMLTAAVSCLAADGTPDQGSSLLLMLFVGFFALIIVFQMVPAVLLFVGMLKGLFSREPKAEKISRNNL